MGEEISRKRKRSQKDYRSKRARRLRLQTDGYESDDSIEPPYVNPDEFNDENDEIIIDNLTTKVKVMSE